MFKNIYNKYVGRLICVAFLSALANNTSAQYTQVTNLTGTATYAGVAVTISTTGSVGSGGGMCLNTPVPYNSGGPSPGSYTFTLSTPVTAIKLVCERIHTGEYVQITVNGTLYPLQPSNVISYTDCAGTYFTSLSGGNLIGPLSGNHSEGTIVIHNCAGISSFNVFCNGTVGGSDFYAYIDPAPCNNGPICAGDTLKLNTTKDSSIATYSWSGPGGFTSTLQSPVIPIVPLADSGIYKVIETVGGVHDTIPTRVVLKKQPVIVAGSNAPICSGNTLSLTATPDSTGETFAWTGPNFFSSPLENPFRVGATVTDSGTYKVIATWNGCKDSSTVHVIIDSTPVVPVAGSNSPICSGSTLFLTSTDGTDGVTFDWSGPGSFLSSAENPTITGAATSASGTYTVSANIGSCHSSATTVVVVNPTPTLPVLGSNSPVCSGLALNLTATSTAGSSYHWTGPNSFTSTLQNPSISPVTLAAGGTYSVVATIGSCSSAMATITVVIDSTPATPVAGSNSPLCTGDNLSLTSSTTTLGSSYSWSGPAGFTSTLQNPGITGVVAANTGTYVVTVGVGTCTSSASTFVTVNTTPAAPVPNSNSPVCSGNPLNLTATSTGSAYNWSGPNGFTSSLQNPTINPATLAASGTYFVYATIGNCVSPTATIRVVVDSTPVVPTVGSNSPLCEGNNLLLTSSDATTGVGYSWSGPGGFTSTLQNPVIPAVTTAAAGNYVVNATLGICVSSASTLVVVNPAPTAPVLGSNAPICSGNPLNLTANTTGTTYSWTGPNGFTSSLQNPTINPAITLSSGTYSFVATLGNCSTAPVTIFALVDSAPATPVVTNNSPGVPSICEGDTLKLMATDATAGVTYSWSGPNSFTSTLQNPIIHPALPVADGVYTVTVNQGGCTVSAVTTVTITPKPVVIATNNGPLCTGLKDTLYLYANSTPGATYSWTGPYVFISLAQNPFRTPVVIDYGGIYQVTVTAGLCKNTVNDTVIVHETPGPPWMSWLTYCQYYDDPPMQSNGMNILWYLTSVTTGVTGSPIPPVPPTSSDTVMWFYSTQTVLGCQSAIDSTKVTVNPKPQVTVSNDTTLCPRDTAILRAVDTDPVAHYLWYPAMYLSSDTAATVIARPETSVTYNVVASNQYGCSDTASVRLVVYPAASIYLGDSVVIYPGESYHIQPQTNCSFFTWTPSAGLNMTNISDPTAAPAISTKYIVIGSTNQGCITSDSINIYVSTESVLTVPNAFAPGTGANSEFKIIKLGIATLQYFRVFDRWGVKVFETTDIDQGWDGSFKGAPQPMGVYIYEIEAVTSTGKVFTKHGNVTLVR